MESQYTLLVSLIIWFATIIFFAGSYFFVIKDNSKKSEENGKKIDQLAEKMGNKLDNIQYDMGILKGNNSMMLKVIEQIDHRTTTLERERRVI